MWFTEKQITITRERVHTLMYLILSILLDVFPIKLRNLFLHSVFFNSFVLFLFLVANLNGSDVHYLNIRIFE